MKRVQVVKSFKKKLLCVAVAAALGGSITGSYAVIDPANINKMAGMEFPANERKAAEGWVKTKNWLKAFFDGFQPFRTEYGDLAQGRNSEQAIKNKLGELDASVAVLRNEVEKFAEILVQFNGLPGSAEKTELQPKITAVIQAAQAAHGTPGYERELVKNAVGMLSDDEVRKLFALNDPNDQLVDLQMPAVMKSMENVWNVMAEIKGLDRDLWSSVFDSKIPQDGKSIVMPDVKSTELKPGTGGTSAVDLSKINLQQQQGSQGLANLVDVRQVQGQANPDIQAKGITLSNFTGSESDLDKLVALQSYKANANAAQDNSRAITVDKANRSIQFGGNRFELVNSTIPSSMAAGDSGGRIALLGPLAMQQGRYISTADGHVVIKDKSDVTIDGVYGTTVTVSADSALRANTAVAVGLFSLDGKVTGYSNAVDLTENERGANDANKKAWNSRYDQPVVLGFLADPNATPAPADEPDEAWLYVNGDGKPVIEGTGQPDQGDKGKFYEAAYLGNGEYSTVQIAKRKERDQNGVEKDVMIEVKDPVRIQRVIHITGATDKRIALDNTVKDKFIVDGTVIVHQDTADRKATGRFVEITLTEKGDFVTQVDQLGNSGVPASYSAHKVILNSKKDFKATYQDGDTTKDAFVAIHLDRIQANTATGDPVDDPKMAKNLAEKGFDSELRIGAGQTAFVDVLALAPRAVEDSGSLVVVHGTLRGRVGNFKELRVAKGAHLQGYIWDAPGVQGADESRVVFKGGTFEGGTLGADAKLENGAVLTLKPTLWPEKLADAAYAMNNTPDNAKGKAVPITLTRTLDASDGALLLQQPNDGTVTPVLNVVDDDQGASGQKGVIKLGSRVMLALADAPNPTDPNAKRPFIKLSGSHPDRMIEGSEDVSVMAGVYLDKQKLADAKKEKKQKGVTLTPVQKSLLTGKDGKYKEQTFLFAESDVDFPWADDDAELVSHSVLFDTTIARGDKVDENDADGKKKLVGKVKRTDNVKANLAKNGATPLGSAVLAAHLKNVGHSIAGDKLPLKDARVLNAVQTAADEDKLKQLSNEVAPHNVTNGGNVMVSRSLMTRVHRSVDQHRNGQNGMVAAGDTFESQGFWGQYIHNDGSQNSKDDFNGFSSKVDGITLGLEAEVSEQMTVGFAFTYAKSDIDTKDVSQSTKGNHYMGTLYAGWADGPWFMDGMLSYAAGKNDYKSTVIEDEAGTSVARSYKGEGDTSTWGVTLGGGYNLPMSDEWTLQPKAELNFFNVKVDDYKLENTDGAFSQQVKTEDMQITELGVGVRVLGDIAMEQGNLKPEFRLMGYYDFNNKKYEGEVKSLSLGGIEKLVGMKREQGRGLAGLGVVYAMDDNLSLGLNYDYNFSGEFKDHSIMAKVSYSF